MQIIYLKSQAVTSSDLDFPFLADLPTKQSGEQPSLRDVLRRFAMGSISRLFLTNHLRLDLTQVTSCDYPTTKMLKYCGFPLLLQEVRRYPR